MSLRTAIVHERFTEFAGSEKVVEQLAMLWPDAPLWTPIARSAGIPAGLEPRVHSSALSRLVGTRGGYAHLLPLLPLAMRHLPVGRPDVVVASHHAFASQVVYATEAPVVAYVHTPARWIWDPALRAGDVGGAVGSALLGGFAAGYRPLDRRAAARLHTIVANSLAVADRIRCWWRQDATVVHPPVDTEFYSPAPNVAREDFLLLAGRLVPYKQTSLAIRAAKRAGRQLIVAGDGRMRAECEAIAGPETTFVGRVTDEQMRSLFRRCAALLMPGVEDFGIVPVEAQACGAPVLATGLGGALDSVLPGVTGDFVEAESADDLYERWADALATFDPSRFDSTLTRRHAERFSRAAFAGRIRGIVEAAA